MAVFDPWGGSWGTSWGNSWAANDEVAPVEPVRTGGGLLRIVYEKPSKHLTKRRREEEKLIAELTEIYDQLHAVAPEAPAVQAAEAVIESVTAPKKTKQSQPDYQTLLKHLQKLQALLVDYERAQQEEEDEMIMLMMAA